MDIDREVLQPLDRILRESYPFSRVKHDEFLTLLDETNGAINRGIITGDVDGFDIPHANKRLADLERRCKSKLLMLRLNLQSRDKAKRKPPDRILSIDELKARLLKRK